MSPAEVTAVTVAREFVSTPLLVERVQVNGREFRSAADVQRAWFDAVALVDTPWFFFVDDTDELPDDLEDLLAACGDAPLSYTDEWVNGQVRRGRPYSRDAHLLDPLLVHHLAVVNTALAREAIAQAPIGHYWPEMLIFWQVARHGAQYLPRVGYHWHRRPSGLHAAPWTGPAIVRSALWCKAHP